MFWGFNRLLFRHCELRSSSHLLESQLAWNSCTGCELWFPENQPLLRASKRQREPTWESNVPKLILAVLGHQKWYIVALGFIWAGYFMHIYAYTHSVIYTESFHLSVTEAKKAFILFCYWRHCLDKDVMFVYVFQDECLQLLFWAVSISFPPQFKPHKTFLGGPNMFDFILTEYKVLLRICKEALCFLQCIWLHIWNSMLWIWIWWKACHWIWVVV